VRLKINICVKVVNAKLYFIFLSILFSVSFHFLSLFYLGLEWSVTSHVTVTVTRSCDVEKVIKGSGIYNII